MLPVGVQGRFLAKTGKMCIRDRCPLGKEQPISAKMKTLEEVTVSIVAKLDEEEVRDMKRQLLQIAEDGKISSEEEEDFREVAVQLDKLAVAISELKLLKQKLLRKG